MFTSSFYHLICSVWLGKDLVSSLCSGLLTIGPRFGGALDDAAKMFAEAQGSGVAPKAGLERCCAPCEVRA